MSHYLGNAHDAPLEMTELNRVPGEPPVRQGVFRLPRMGEAGVGIWMMEVGVDEGVPKEELCVIIEGKATVTYSATGEELHVGPGDMLRLHAGQATRWQVHETLRKVYVNLD